MPLNRRSFIKKSALAGSGIALSTTTDTLPSSFDFPLSKNFQLKIFATNWGFSGGIHQFCKKAKAEGYDGIEVWAPRGAKARDELMNAVEKNNLAYGFLVGNSGNSFKQNLEVFQEYVSLATTYRPLFINCHSGKDFFSFDENKQFIDFTTQISQASQIPIYHETHRARILFAAHIARKFIEAIPDLKLTLDISHWTCVAGSLLEDQQATVLKALERTEHIHSRIGLSNGPQIPDPRAPEFQKEVAAHFAWWDKVVELKSNKGELLTMTTEFGPSSYMWTLPYTKQPVANLWEVNAYMMRMWRERYA
jgi:hypothetical protein